MPWNGFQPPMPPMDEQLPTKYSINILYVIISQTGRDTEGVGLSDAPLGGTEPLVGPVLRAGEVRRAWYPRKCD